MAARITELVNLPPVISSETEVDIPGYYLTRGATPDRWLLRSLEDHLPVRVVRVVWAPPFACEGVPLPETEDTAARVAWAGERLWDLAEGRITGEQGCYVLDVLLYWRELSNEGDRATYKELARRFREQLAG